MVVVMQCEIKFFAMSQDGRRMYGHKKFQYRAHRRAQDAIAATNACAHGRLLAAQTFDVPVDHINVTSFVVKP